MENCPRLSEVSYDAGVRDHMLGLVAPSSSVFISRPMLEIIEQPRELFRFRYLTESQGPPHGALVGASATKSIKSFPTVRLCNFSGEAVIRCWLVSDASPPIPHVHRLVTRVGNKGIKEEPHDILVNETNNYIASFENLVIIHAVKRTCQEHYAKKRVNFKTCSEKGRTNSGAYSDRRDLKKMEEDIGKINMNIARLYFEALIFVNGGFHRISEAVSYPIKNKKNSEFGDLKIVRSDKNSGTCMGGDEIFIFVEKVQKDIKIKFYEENNFGETIWSQYAKFSPLDIHHMVAIAFRTPGYKEPFISSPAKVKYFLERPKDGHVSNSMDFTFLPDNHRHSVKRPCLVGSLSQPTKRISEISLEKLLDDQDLNSFLSEQIFDLNELWQLPESLMADCPKIEPTFDICNKNYSKRSSGETIVTHDYHGAEEIRGPLALLSVTDGNSILNLEVILNYERLNSILSLINAFHHRSLRIEKNFKKQAFLHIAVRVKRPSIVKMPLKAIADPKAMASNFCLERTTIIRNNRSKDSHMKNTRDSSKKGQAPRSSEDLDDSQSPLLETQVEKENASSPAPQELLGVRNLLV